MNAQLHLTKLRPVRDQTSKTFDIYVIRIRKHASNLPGTALPPSATTAVNGAMPRIGTPQNDTGWAGWAISSFTNKLATANGEMQAKLSKEPRGPVQGRSSSTPPTTDGTRPAFTVASASQLHRQAVKGSPAPVLTRTSTDQFFSDAQQEDDEIDEAWGDLADESFFDASSQELPLKASTVPASTNLIDDGSEPDFEGWLKAQAQAKTKAQLPKGLVKPSNAAKGRQSVVRSTTTGHVDLGLGAKKLASTTNVDSKHAVAKAIDTKPKEPAGDDDWGDAWD